MFESWLLYSLILVPLVLYVVAFSFETYMSIKRLFTKHYSQGAGYIHATWEVTHTLLVYSFIIFMTSHSEILPQLAPIIFLPVSIIAIGLMLRAALYLYLFYGQDTPRAPKLSHILFALCHIVPLAALAYVIKMVALYLWWSGFTPSTQYIWAVVIGFVVTVGFCVIPLTRLYSSDRS